MSEPLHIVPVPPLAAVLLNKEQAKGAPLTQSEVEAIRDGAACIMMTTASWKAVEAERGYVDIRPEHAWEEWQQVRKYLGQTD